MVHPTPQVKFACMRQPVFKHNNEVFKHFIHDYQVGINSDVPQRQSTVLWMLSLKPWWGLKQTHYLLTSGSHLWHSPCFRSALNFCNWLSSERFIHSETNSSLFTKIQIICISKHPRKLELLFHSNHQSCRMNLYLFIGPQKILKVSLTHPYTIPHPHLERLPALTSVPYRLIFWPCSSGPSKFRRHIGFHLTFYSI